MVSSPVDHTRRAGVLLALLALLVPPFVTAFSVCGGSCPRTILPSGNKNIVSVNQGRRRRPVLTNLWAEAESAPAAPAPVLDGNRVLPLKIMKAGLKGHKVAAVYALLNSDYKRGYVS